MNQSALKNYAPQARLDFIQAVKDRAAFFGLTPESRVQIQETGDVVIISGQAFPKVVAQQRKALLQRIAAEGYEAVMEAMAYTWFNRFVALRFMEVHGYLDHGYRVLSHPAGKPNPEILDHAERVTLPGLDPQQVIQLKLDGNRDAELYRLLMVAQCNALHQAIPFVFGKIADETELLLPDNLLHSNSVIRRLVSSIEETDWQEVEVLGWLYQFYISDKKDAVMARKSAVPTEDIPAVTQLFTPHWIVRYLVENSLGRLWLLNRPTSRLKEHMPYYIEGDRETDFLKIVKPEEIRVCDPACGSGHMLTYAFDLLCLIYEEEGYAPSEIPGLILRHNLHGLEICPRAAQLAEMSLIFKAREKSRRFFQAENLVRPRIIELRDVRFAENELRDYIHALGLGNIFQHTTLTLLHQFEEAKNFGSLIQPCLTEAEIQSVRSAIQNSTSIIQNSDLMVGATHRKVLRVLEQAEALTQRYHVVVANPPYMGQKQMNSILKAFCDLDYPRTSSDLFAVFIDRGFGLVFEGGYSAMVTMQSWMFLPSYEEMRSEMLRTHTIVSLVHMGSLVMGIAFGTAATIWRNKTDKGVVGSYSYVDYADLLPSGEPVVFPVRNGRCITASAVDFVEIPGCPIAYWTPPSIRQAFRACRKIGEIGDAKNGMTTGENERFVRFWHELPECSIDLNRNSSNCDHDTDRDWVPYSKGGPFRKWFGNADLVLNWGRDGELLRSNKPKTILRNPQYYFREAISWSLTSMLGFGARHRNSGYAFDVNGMSLFVDKW